MCQSLVAFGWWTLGDYFWRMFRIQHNAWFDSGYNICGSLRIFCGPSYLAVTCPVLYVADECTKMRIFLGVHFRSCFCIQRLLARQWIQVWRQSSSTSVRTWHVDIVVGPLVSGSLLFRLGLKSTWFGIFWEILPETFPYSALSGLTVNTWSGTHSANCACSSSRLCSCPLLCRTGVWSRQC